MSLTPALPDEHRVGPETDFDVCVCVFFVCLFVCFVVFTRVFSPREMIRNPSCLFPSEIRAGTHLSQP